MSSGDQPPGSITDNAQAWITWAHEYDGYTLLAESPQHLGALLEPARAGFRSTGQAPAWCGTHLLRGWLFYLARADRQGGGYGLEPGGGLVAEWEAVVAALRASR